MISVAYDLLLASLYLVTPGVCWSGCLCLEQALGCFRSFGRPMVLAVADIMWCLLTMGSSDGQKSYGSVSLAAVDLLRGLQTIGSSEEQSSCFLVFYRGTYGL